MNGHFPVCFYNQNWFRSRVITDIFHLWALFNQVSSTPFFSLFFFAIFYPYLIAANQCYRVNLLIQSEYEHFSRSDYLDRNKNFIIAFVWNGKSFAIAILVSYVCVKRKKLCNCHSSFSFFFFLLVTFSGQTGKSYFQSFVQLLLWARVTRIGAFRNKQ